MVFAPRTVFEWAVPTLLIVVYGTALGVFIDLDHFVIARAKTGSWRAARFCLENPVAAVADQDLIFDPGDVGVLSRLLSHLVIAGVLVTGLLFVSVPLAAVSGAVLYVHIVSDVIWDRWQVEHHLEGAATEQELRETFR